MTWRCAISAWPSVAAAVTPQPSQDYVVSSAILGVPLL
jgi:hypothetical protein